MKMFPKDHAQAVQFKEWLAKQGVKASVIVYVESGEVTQTQLNNLWDQYARRVPDHGEEVK